MTKSDKNLYHFSQAHFERQRALIKVVSSDTAKTEASIEPTYNLRSNYHQQSDQNRTFM
uniref:GSVIVT00026702001, RPS5 n=1 Tax=Arundo donax TaxID=35708 RepID=A0A0A9B8E7_ARUDO